MPEDLRDRLVKWARGWMTSKVVEDAVHVCKQRTVASTNGQLARAHRLAALQESDLLEEYGMTPVRPDQSDKPAAKGVDCSMQDLYDACFEEFSVDTAEFRALLHGQQDNSFPSIEPETLHQSGLTFKAYQQAGSWVALERAWKSIFPLVGLLLVRNEGKLPLGLVLHSCVDFLSKLEDWSVQCSEQISVLDAQR